MRVMITGAARGLGLCMVKEGLSRGHFIVAAVRELSSGAFRTPVEEETHNEMLEILNMDVAMPFSIHRAAAQLSASLEGLEAIVNNAAVLLGREATLEDVDIRAIMQSMEVNCYGPIRVTQAFLPLLKQGKGQKYVLNISSESGSYTDTRADDYPYCISKGALNMASEKMRQNLAPHGIGVMAVHPGWMCTDMGGPRGKNKPEDVAVRLWDMLEGKCKVDAIPAIVDAFGQPLPL
ncbi:MAG: SDR family NAD(P)-dependent oxidoreductase [Clostridiales bacterium]|nr:SDR family NAD(P)-dependent oxidoreductase [Clostridiales bacterium]